ncbi:MAG: rRNA small subunit methyltransferase A [Mycoplasmataceae bacterium RC_NB112A]|nr:MAG: rRNA small subunit methyltransferase A [Mycoplasmataceae bacterium RC_NB112A]
MIKSQEFFNENKRKKITPRLVYPPRKKLGQNFLWNENYLRKIVAACPLESSTIVIEIGSGYGNLTNWLAKTNCQKIISLEKDERLFKWLTSQQLLKNDKVLFLHQDALKINWLTWVEKWKGNPLVAVGNLPYSIANSLIIGLLMSRLFKNFIFLVQQEVAQRWVASPLKYVKHYSVLSVFINYLAQTEIIFTVPANVFIPTPPVNGALVKIKPYQTVNLSLKDLQSFLSFLKKCFNFRRKTLLNNLNKFKNRKEWGEYFKRKNYALSIRPQNLTPTEYWELFIFSQELS